MANENSNVVVDRAQSHWSDLWKKEDYWAIWLGFALLIAAICIFINGAPASYKETIDKSNAIMKVEAEKAPFKTIAYIQAQDAKKGVVGTNLPIAKEIKAFIASRPTRKKLKPPRPRPKALSPPLRPPKSSPPTRATRMPA